MGLHARSRRGAVSRRPISKTTLANHRPLDPTLACQRHGFARASRKRGRRSGQNTRHHQENGKKKLGIRTHTRYLQGSKELSDGSPTARRRNRGRGSEPSKRAAEALAAQ